MTLAQLVFAHNRDPIVYLKRIKIKDIRCIAELDINLESGATANNSLVLLGNNGVGKSTLLKCVAIGLCDSAGASGLLADMYGSMIRAGKKEGKIELFLNSGTKDFKITTRVIQSAEDPDIEDIQKSTSREFPWSKLFVAGYGPSRVLDGTNSYDQYALADAVYSLFNYSWKLQNPELIMRRIGWNNRKAMSKLIEQLAGVLMIDAKDLKLEKTGLSLEEKSGVDISFGAMADGHRSAINWVLDLIGWTYLNNKKIPTGIVLVDEIENHLHPVWQRQILKRLVTAFPKVQFIASSHSLLCAAGTTDKVKRFNVGETHILRKDKDGNIESIEADFLDELNLDQALEW